MSGLKPGDAFPSDVTFTYVPPTGDLNLTACGLPIKYDASKGEHHFSPSSSALCLLRIK